MRNKTHFATYTENNKKKRRKKRQRENKNYKSVQKKIGVFRNTRCNCKFEEEKKTELEMNKIKKSYQRT